MKRISNILVKKEKITPPPIWIMRQAGRYLPEYREVRSKTKNFLDLCYNPQLVKEVTLQPIRRFDFDAAIIFSDILVIPDMIGVDVKFISGEGPKLGSFSIDDLSIDGVKEKLSPVYEAIKITRLELSKEKDLIGFSGSPWTLACYMIDKGSSKNFALTRRMAIEDEVYFEKLINLLSEAVVEYLILQIEAGVDVIKLFDSWAGILPQDQFRKWVIKPNKFIINKIREKYPNFPIICFPKSASFMYEEFVSEVNCDAIAIDQSTDLDFAHDILHKKHQKVVQGNLDNFLLAFGSKDDIRRSIDKILDKLSPSPFIFNLGHGILPETPISNVEFLVDYVRNYRA